MNIPETVGSTLVRKVGTYAMFCVKFIPLAWSAAAEIKRW